MLNEGLAQVIDISKEVMGALAEHQPVVALESTIISHGMPYPQNIETALEVEKIIRAQGVVPATIAVMEGKIRVGLSPGEIESFGKKDHLTPIYKLSRRDLPLALAQKHSGATTVAATMICANLAGIRVFATGGIGGVHRGAEKTFDISADLQELSKTSVAVVCAGAKSILDIGLTLEVLETLGVPVVGYQTDRFPGFYTRETPFSLEYRLNQTREIAQMMKYQTLLGYEGGLLIANPIPKESELPAQWIERMISEALLEAQSKGIQGKEVTPFLLSSLGAQTKGQSLQANISLVQNNARVAAQIARDYSLLHEVSS